MAYRFDTGIARAIGASADSLAPDLAVQPGAGSAAIAALTPIQHAPAFQSSMPSVDFALHAPTPFATAKGMPGGDQTGPGILVGDDIPDDTSTTVYLNAQEGQVVHSQLDTVADHDFFGAVMGGGTTYEFTLTPDDASSVTGPDLLINVYDSNGDLVTSLDGGSSGATEHHDFTPTDDGTYYIDVGAYLDASFGAYTLQVNIEDTPDPNAGTPLDAIDWGGTANRVDTDGVESPNGDDVIQFYFAKTGEVYESNLAAVVIAEDWQPFEKEAVYTAFDQYDHIINTDYVEVATAAEADMVLISHAFEPNILGSMSPPNEPHEGQGEFNNVGVGWDEEGLVQGGFGFITLIHEFGHGHGLAHPHDTGGGSTVMNGVVEEPPPSALDYTTGDYGLNTGVYTTMSYNDGWDKDGPNGSAPENGYGYQGTLMAFDIGVLQQKYGANMHYKEGDNTYTLSHENAPGTFFSCIWDAGGTDTIQASGTLDSVVDLRAATLDYEPGGGGFVSWEDGIFGGFTVANGVVIENGYGAKGNDTITGNGTANHLLGGGGEDAIDGGLGIDTIDGGKGTDTLTGGGDDDIFVFGGKLGHDTIGDLSDGDVIDVSGIDAIAGGGDDAFVVVNHYHGVAGELLVKYIAGDDVTKFAMDLDGDKTSDMTFFATGDHSGYDNFIL